jgi:ribosome maturation factor RimP
VKEEVTMSEAEFGGPLVARIVALAQPIIDDLGLVLYDCEHHGGSLIITLDKPGGVLLDELSLFTRLLSRELDHEDPVPGRYTLEVSSPGLERNLRRPDHYAGAIGQPVAIRLAQLVDGTRRVDGTLVAAGEDGITVRLDDAELSERHLRYHDIERAKTVFTWGPAPKPGKGPSAKRRGAGAASPDVSGADDPSTTHSKEAAAS